MPAISLVVCVHNERDLLARLLEESAGLFDDLVVVHDGPEHGASLPIPSPTGEVPPAIDYSKLSFDAPLPNGYSAPARRPVRESIHERVITLGGRYFEGPRCFQQEPHWPFAWSRAKHDWILRLDADEFPSAEMKQWLTKFQMTTAVDPTTSGFICIWPVWNGKKRLTQSWPIGRNFLFDRRRVRFFGMAEQVPVADDHYGFVDVTLCHQPNRKSHGLANILHRKQGRYWRDVIARSLIGQPQDLPHWRWDARPWPEFWKRLRSGRIHSLLYFLIRNTLATLRDQWRAEEKFMPFIAIATPLHHLMIALSIRRMRRAAAAGMFHKDRLSPSRE